MLTLAGRVGSQSAELLATAIAAAMHRAPRVVVDFGQVDYISSAGLEVLEDAARQCARNDGILVVSTVMEPVRLALDLGGLLPSVAVESTREQAILRAADAPPALK